ncbi:MAG: MFS transporter [Thermomicrobiales bacterium]|nr:MAG: MFS transporter [Thermomicrobiales bacterium]
MERLNWFHERVSVIIPHGERARRGGEPVLGLEEAQAIVTSQELRMTTPPRAARRAVITVFAINGAALSSWFPHIPAVQRKLELSDGALGAALLGVPAGALLSMISCGWLLARFGSATVTRAAVLALCVTLPLPGLAPNIALLALSLGLLGMANGTLDVAMNAQAVEVERLYRRPIMASFHAAFSLGGLLSAGLAIPILSLGTGTVTHLTGAALALGLGALIAVRWLLPTEPEAGRGPAFARPTRSLLWLGIIAFCVLLGEGAMADWSAVYLRNTLETSAGLAAAGYAVFSGAMALGRLTGDRLTARLGPERLIRFGGLVVAIGLGLAVVIAHPASALIGFASVGVGLSCLFPVLLSAAARTGNVATGPALAAVTAVGYTGFLAGPPLIGFVAEGITLRWALGLVAGAGSAVSSPPLPQQCAPPSRWPHRRPPRPAPYSDKQDPFLQNDLLSPTGAGHRRR